MMKYNYIAIEGNIGAGKTTLSTLLARYMDADLVLENFSGNNFLAEFYRNPDSHAFPLEVSFLLDRYALLKERLKKAQEQQKPLVVDFLLKKSMLFAQINLPAEEFALFRNLDAVLPVVPADPDLLIYLHAPISKLVKNIARRNRSFEKFLEPAYLEKIQKAYQLFMKQVNIPVIILEMDEVDFHLPEHFSQLTNFLEKGYDFEQHYMQIK